VASITWSRSWCACLLTLFTDIRPTSTRYSSVTNDKIVYFASRFCLDCDSKTRYFSPIELHCMHFLEYFQYTHTHTHTSILLPFFWDHPGKMVPEENFWALFEYTCIVNCSLMPYSFPVVHFVTRDSAIANRLMQHSVSVEILSTAVQIIIIIIWKFITGTCSQALSMNRRRRQTNNADRSLVSLRSTFCNGHFLIGCMHSSMHASGSMSMHCSMS